ncbi:hypothetical protein JTE90_017664 [Oedothorax gibbosus]|uniref:Uncharacterized protein n=1 Tax=Oedothorax gibbosus TaxID=931172 RepID=A0AAV6UHD8_9ARAC|nr:hypothetical protein JTE90_017664 [Oedothorax gibbosus]
MAKYIKNDINFHGARSKTRVVENPSSNKNKKRDDDGWGSVPSSSMNNNSDHGWGEIPSDGAIHKDTWESDRLVYGKSERNRKFRLDNDNSSFRVPIQSVPNWEKADTEFPSLGSHSDNVWERRKRKQEEVAAIAPANETEEEMMVRKALELSMKEAKIEEERRRHLEEEYRLQMQMLEANPDMFEEFRADQNEFPSSAGGFDNHSQEDFPNDEKDESDKGAWGFSNKKTTKEKPKNKTEDLEKVKNDFPQLKQKSALPSFNGTSQSKNKVSQAVEMFGGWGTPKPFTHQNATVAKSQSKPSQWQTVDTAFVPLPLKKTVIEEQPTVEPQTPPSLEVKLENTTNCDADDAMCAKFTSEVIEPRNSEAMEPRNNLGTRDVVELNLKDAELGYSLDQKDKEFESQTKRKRPKAKLGRRIKEKESNLVPEVSRIETSVQEADHSTEVKINDLVPEEARSRIVVQKEDQRLDASCDRLSSEHNNQTNNSMEFKSMPEEKNAVAQSEFGGAKCEIDLLKGEFPESQKAVECDYAFLLNQIDVTSTVTNSEDTSLSIKPPLATESTSNSLPEIYQTTFNIDNFFAEASSSEELPIPGPVPFRIKPPSASNPNSISANNNPNSSSWNETNSNDMFKTPDAFNDAPPLRTFGGYPTNPESFDLPDGTSLTSTNETPSLPTYGGFLPNDGVNHMPVADNGASHVGVPSVAPEFVNPTLFMQPTPFLTPMMNPALMMNPLMMQQQMMMMSNHHFFLQQLAQMEMYYKSMGMPVTPGMPTFPQATPTPAFNAQNFQAFNPENMHEPQNVTSDPTEPIPPPIHRPANQIPGMEPNQPQNVPPLTAEQPSSEPFWFEDYMSSDPVIPPPVPSSTPRIPLNPGNRIPVNPDNLPGAFSSMSLQGKRKETSAPNTTNQGLSKEIIPNQPAPRQQSPVLTGWGSIDGDGRSEESSGWDNSVDGWGGSDTTQSMRKSSRYAAENRANIRQPTSRPNLRRPKS